MKIQCDDRVAIVTGAGAGLGRSYALLLASRGAKVVVNDIGGGLNGAGRAATPADDVVREIRDNGGVAVANYDDVSHVDGAQDIIDDALNHFGTVDILINNAGILRDKSFLKMDMDDYVRIIEVHLLGAVYTTKAAFPIMREKGYGRIVNTTSTSGLYGNFGQTNYGAAKMGIIGFMNALKQEGKKYNVLVNAIAPIAGTRMGEGTYPDELMPLLRPDLVASAVVFLASDQCDFTGHMIVAGGGRYARVQLVEGKGIWVDPRHDFTPEMFAERLDDITNMEDARAFENFTEELTTILKHCSR